MDRYGKETSFLLGYGSGGVQFGSGSLHLIKIRVRFSVGSNKKLSYWTERAHQLRMSF